MRKGGQGPLRVALVSLGCPKNLVDSEKMLGALAEGGCLVGAPMDRADVIVINTCGFLAAAREESLAVIDEALALKRAGAAKRVVVAGCLVNRDGRDLYVQARGIDAIVGVNDRGRILSAVRGRRRVTGVSPCSGEIHADAGRFRLTPRHTAYLRIAEGCSQRCSFCTIPAIRGPLRSKPPEMVLDEARELIADGAAELNLIAQDTTAYGADLRPRTDLARLLRRLDALDGVRWLRLLYAYPRRLTDELIGAIAECRRVVKYVDLPLQHVSDPILGRMRRRVKRAEIETLLGKLRDRVRGIAVRTAFIVGFPGETDRQFAELLEFVRGFRFDAVGAFEFSPEPGTPSAGMPRQVPRAVKAERFEELMRTQRRIAESANRRRLGRPIEVLVDGPSLSKAGRCFSRHAGQAPDIDGVCWLTHPRRTGSFVEGKVIDSVAYDLVVECGARNAE